MIDLIPYGLGPDQFGELGLPDGYRSRPLVILIHGGFWRDQYRLDLMHNMSGELHRLGYATWNIEYRRVGASGGGFPTTLDDVAAAIDRFAGLDWDKIAVIGHSAGGHLALWNASRATAPMPPDLTISLAGVNDVIAANRLRAGADATSNFFGGDYDSNVEAYTAGQPDPASFSGRVVLIHGDSDDNVPLEQSTDLGAYVDRVEVLVGADHFDVIDPGTAAWSIILDELESLTQRP